MTAPMDTSTPASLAPTPARTGSSWWIVLLLLAAVALAYSNSFPGAFFFDDDGAIVQNPSIRSLTAIDRILFPPVEAGVGGRPFANLTYAVNYALGETSPWGYHVVDVLIQLASTAVLFGVVRRTLLTPRLGTRFAVDARWIAAAVAAFWALHPLHPNIVDYASQRTEGLMATLYLFTLYAFIRSTERDSVFWVCSAVLACGLGMATKEVMVTAPAIVLLYDRTFLSGSFLAALRRHWGRHLALAATWALLAALMLGSRLSARGVGFDLGHTPHDYALTEIRSVIRYLQLSYWPHPLVFDYGPEYLHRITEVWPAAVALTAALLGTAVAVWRAPVLGFCAAWFFVLLSPSSSFIPVVQQPCAENRIHLPLVGSVALLVAVGYSLSGRRALLAVGAASLALGVATAARNPVFGSELAVWWDTVAKRPRNERAANNLGNALLKLQRHEEAMPYFEQALLLSPRYADAHNNRGVVLLRQGAPKDAAAAFMAAIEFKSDYADAYYNLGEAYLQLHRPEDATKVLQKSLSINPSNPKALNNLSIALLDTGHVKESIAAVRSALQLQSNMPEAHYNLGNSLSRAGQEAEALREYDTTLAIDPEFAKAHNNAGVILLRQGKREQAAARFRAALDINPQYPEARRNLDIVAGPSAP